MHRINTSYISGLIVAFLFISSNSLQASDPPIASDPLLTSDPSIASDPLLEIMATELDREFSLLSAGEIPPYYLDYRVNDRLNQHIEAIFGSLSTSNANHSRTLFSSLRIGDYVFDNTHPEEDAMDWGGGNWAPASDFPLDNDEVAIRQKLWRITDANYKSALASYKTKLGNKKSKDSIPDFSREAAHTHIDPPLSIPWDDQIRANWENKLREISGIFLNESALRNGSASLEFINERKYFVSTEGSRIAQNHQRAQLVISASIVADDGTRIPLTEVYHGRTPDELPSLETLEHDARALVSTLLALAEAPLAEPYTGPAILSSSASGVFFHEIFGHRIEGHRLKNKTDGQTFKDRIGESVLSNNLSVISDPTVDQFEGQYLSGSYAFDEQGVPGQKVSVVEEGILQNFLMSRRPLFENSISNGHGRADAGMAPVSRQSNLFISADKGYSDQQLRKMLQKQCKKQGLEYGYYIAQVAGGFTTTDRYRPNVFNVEPRLVYRVYVDGRPDELVRGVTLIGTPLVMFSGIEAAGSSQGIFNGICGAESGGVPVSTVAPALLVGKIETQKIPEGNSKKSILPIPGGPELEGDAPTEGDIVMQAMEDEMKRNMEDLSYKDYQAPFFISYSLSRNQVFAASASLGSILRSNSADYSTSNVRLMVGDYEINDENYDDHRARQSGNGGYIPTPQDIDYWGLRRSFWLMTDQVYKSAGALHKNKVEALKNNSLPEDYESLPDFSREEATLLRIEREQDSSDTASMTGLVRRLSSVMRDYPEIIASEVSVEYNRTDHYFTSTEGSRIRYPEDQITLGIQLECQGDNGQNAFRIMSYSGRDLESLPSEEKIKTELESVIDSLILAGKAPSVDDRYFGPVLFLDEAARETMAGLLAEALSGFAAFRPTLVHDQQGNLYANSTMSGEHPRMGERLFARDVNLRALSHLREYGGAALTGYYPVDAEGVVPEDTLVLVKEGILVGKLNGRTPSPELAHSTGHKRLSPFAGSIVAPGILEMEYTGETRTEDELKAELIQLALVENLDYAYIIRSTMGGGIPVPLLLYRVDLKSGSEELVRILSTIQLPERSLRSIERFSGEQIVLNLNTALSMGAGLGNASGLSLSMIFPDAFIVEDVSLNPLFSPVSVAKPIVPNKLD